MSAYLRPWAFTHLFLYRDAFLSVTILVVLYGFRDLFVTKVAELKQKASKAKDATVTSVKNTKDRHTRCVLRELKEI
jgi:hypothetical protein